VFESFTPACRPRSRFLSVSLAVHACAATVLATVHFAPSIKTLPHRAYVTLIAPAPAAYKPPRLYREQPRVVETPPAPAPVHVAAREFHAPPAPARPAPAKVQLVAIATPEPARVNLPLAPIEAPHLEHVRPRILKTDNLDGAPAPAAPVVAARAGTRSSGFGGIETAAPGTSHRAIASTGFDSTGSATASSTTRAAISTNGFGDAAFVTAAGGLPTRKADAPAAAVTPVEILSKPRPAYTAEARALHLEGEVLLEIEFAASGELRIVRVARGLGHGLDESAIAAARQIHFRPALRTGAPVDSTALVHIQFQLAY